MADLIRLVPQNWIDQAMRIGWQAAYDWLQAKRNATWGLAVALEANPMTTAERIYELKAEVAAIDEALRRVWETAAVVLPEG